MNRASRVASRYGSRNLKSLRIRCRLDSTSSQHGQRRMASDSSPSSGAGWMNSSMASVPTVPKVRRLMELKNVFMKPASGTFSIRDP